MPKVEAPGHPGRPPPLSDAVVNSSNVGKCFGVESKGLYQSSGKEKEVVVLFTRPRQNVKLGTFML